jgi:hypothetical protein
MHEGEGENTGEIHLKRIVHNVQVVIDMEPEEAVSRVIVITCLTLPLAFFAVLLLSLPVLFLTK